MCYKADHNVACAYLELLRGLSVHEREHALSIVFAGGGGCLHGIAKKMLLEMQQACRSSYRYRKLLEAVHNVQFSNPPFAAADLPWIGAALLSQCQTSPITREMYHEKGPVAIIDPDAIADFRT